MVLSREPLSSCHAGEVRVKRSPPAWSHWLLVAAVAAGWLALGEVGKVEADDGFERLGRSAVAQAVRKYRKPVGIRCLEVQQFFDCVMPALWAAATIGWPARSGSQTTCT